MLSGSLLRRIEMGRRSFATKPRPGYLGARPWSTLQQQTAPNTEVYPASATPIKNWASSPNPTKTSTIPPQRSATCSNSPSKTTKSPSEADPSSTRNTPSKDYQLNPSSPARPDASQRATYATSKQQQSAPNYSDLYYPQVRHEYQRCHLISDIWEGSSSYVVRYCISWSRYCLTLELKPLSFFRFRRISLSAWLYFTSCDIQKDWQVFKRYSYQKAPRVLKTMDQEKTSTFPMSSYLSQRMDSLEEGVSRSTDSTLTASHMLQATFMPRSSNFLQQLLCGWTQNKLEPKMGLVLILLSTIWLQRCLCPKYKLCLLTVSALMRLCFSWSRLYSITFQIYSWMRLRWCLHRQNHSFSLQFFSLKTVSGMTLWTRSTSSSVMFWGLPSALMQKCMARKRIYSSKVSWYFMSFISEKTWQTIRRRRVRSFLTSACQIQKGRQQYFLKMRVGVSQQKLLAKEKNRFDTDRFQFFLGNQKILVISCSCSRTRSSFLPIQWKSLKSRLDLSPISLLTLLQTSSTVSYSVIVMTIGSSQKSVCTLMSIFSARSFFFFSYSSLSLSWKRSLPNLISVPQRMVKAYFYYFFVRKLDFRPLIAEFWPRVNLFSQELLAILQKFQGKLSALRKYAGSRLISQ